MSEANGHPVERGQLPTDARIHQGRPGFNVVVAKRVTEFVHSNHTTTVRCAVELVVEHHNAGGDGAGQGGASAVTEGSRLLMDATEPADHDSAALKHRRGSRSIRSDDPDARKPGELPTREFQQGACQVGFQFKRFVGIQLVGSCLRSAGDVRPLEPHDSVENQELGGSNPAVAISPGPLEQLAQGGLIV